VENRERFQFCDLLEIPEATTRRTRLMSAKMKRQTKNKPAFS
jgi:hypothetical protein